MEAIVIFSSFLIFMAMGMPIGTALGIAAVITIYWFDLGIAMLGVNFSSGIASFPLLAIPFFVLAKTMPMSRRAEPELHRPSARWWTLRLKSR